MNSKEDAYECCEAVLKNLQTEYIDLFLVMDKRQFYGLMHYATLYDYYRYMDPLRLEKVPQTSLNLQRMMLTNTTKALWLMLGRYTIGRNFNFALKVDIFKCINVQI